MLTHEHPRSHIFCNSKRTLTQNLHHTWQWVWPSCMRVHISAALVPAQSAVFFPLCFRQICANRRETCSAYPYLCSSPTQKKAKRAPRVSPCLTYWSLIKLDRTANTKRSHGVGTFN
uniref:Uncharacterized protein n=1 Tax=Anguilla anguilla TaxID=7936 RepID=A0A0E9X564_ANGAN